MKQYKQKIRLGDLLLQQEIITEEQLESALLEQKKTHLKMGAQLIQQGFVTQQTINEVLEFQLGIPYVNVKEYNIDVKAVKLVPETIARRHNLIPIKMDSIGLTVAMEDPLNIFALDDVKIITGKNIFPVMSEEKEIKKVIEKYYGSEQALKAAEEFKLENSNIDEKDLESEEDIKSAPIVKLIKTVIEQAVRNRASDIHVEPYEKEIRVRYRIDGALKTVYTYDTSLLGAIVARIKIISDLDIAEKRRPQDGRINTIVDGGAYDIRVSVLPTVYGEKVVMRVNSKEGFKKGKDQLGFFKDDLEKFEGILSNPHGIILVTGPTGSGKSTTLYTSLNEINREDINIITVEDPVESQIEGINQVQVNTKAGLTFATALRSILRQDPDVIMIGEIRDNETAEIAVKASITGHLVVSTLHTNDAASSITRLIDMGVEPFLVGASIVGIIAQRLVRRLCPKCREKIIATEDDKYLLGIDVSEDLEIYKAKGCHICNNTGYQGRIGVYEILPVDNKIRDAINKNKNADEIKKIAGEEGLKTIRENAKRLVLDGTTTVEEMMRIAYGTE